MALVIERQVIVTWYTPKEKLPPEYMTVLATISGVGCNNGYGIMYDHALMVMEYAEDGCGWLSVDGIEFDELTVHAWADIEAYGTKDGEVIDRNGGTG